MAYIRYFNSRNIIQVICNHKQLFHCSSCLRENGANVREELFIPYQTEPGKKLRKASAIGAAGQVAVVMASNFLLGNVVDEIVMVDRKEAKDKLAAHALDMAHGMGLRRLPNLKICTDLTNTKDSDFIFISSGVPTVKGQTRLDIAKTNVAHFKEIIPPLAKLSPNAVILVASNPADIMTYAAWKFSKFPKHRVIGTGCDLDTARLRWHIGKRLGINPISVDAWVIGEHGDSSVPLWSLANIAGTRLRDLDSRIGDCDDPDDWDALHKQTVKDGLMLVDMKGCTNWGICNVGEAVAKAVLTDSKCIRCVSTYAKGMYGINEEMFISLPCVLGNRGVCQIVHQCLSDEETAKLYQSTAVLAKVMKPLF